MNQVVKNYKDLVVWQKAVELSVVIYQITEGFPKSEIFGLVSQMRRASVSIASNIAEGNGRFNRSNDYAHFLRIAYGSAQELETQVEIAKRLNYLKHEKATEVEEFLSSILKMLNKMITINLTSNNQ